MSYICTHTHTHIQPMRHYDTCAYSCVHARPTPACLLARLPACLPVCLPARRHKRTLAHWHTRTHTGTQAGTHSFTPLHSAPLHSTPVQSTPLHSTPLHCRDGGAAERLDPHRLSGHARQQGDRLPATSLQVRSVFEVCVLRSFISCSRLAA